MATSSSVYDRFIRIDETGSSVSADGACLEKTGMVEVYKAFDISSGIMEGDGSGNKSRHYVMLIELNRLWSDLPNSTWVRLHEAIAVGKELAETSPQSPSVGAASLDALQTKTWPIQPIMEAHLPNSTHSTHKSDQEQDKSSVDFVVLPWTNRVCWEDPEDQWLRRNLTPAKALEFVADLANQLNLHGSIGQYLSFKLSDVRYQMRENGWSFTVNAFCERGILTPSGHETNNGAKHVKSVHSLLVQMLRYIDCMQHSHGGREAFLHEIQQIEQQPLPYEDQGEPWEGDASARGVHTEQLVRFVTEEPPDNLEDYAKGARACLAPSDEVSEQNGVEHENQSSQPAKTTSDPERLLISEQPRIPEHLCIVVSLGSNRYKYGQLLPTEDRGIIRLGDTILPIKEIDSEAGIDKNGENPRIIANHHDYLKEVLQRRRIYIQRHDIGKRTANQPAAFYYTISDIDNTGGEEATYLNGQPLSPLFSALLRPGAIIEVAQDMELCVVSKAHGRPAGWVEAQRQNKPALKVKSHVIVPGNERTIDLPVTVSNPTNRVEDLTIAIDGVPPDWPILKPQSASLFEDESKSVILTLPLPDRRLAHPYRLMVRLISGVLNTQVAACEVTLEIPRQSHLQAFVQPEALEVGRYGTLRIENLGNYMQTYRVEWQDREGVMQFESRQVRVNLPAYATSEIQYRATLKWYKRRLFGNEKRYGQTVTITPQNGEGLEPMTVQGELIATPLPAWIPVGLVLLLTGCFLLWALLFPPHFSSQPVNALTPESESVVAADKLTLVWESANSCFYSLAKDGRTIDRGWSRREGQAHVEGITARTLKPGEMLQVQLRSCSLIRTTTWDLPVVAAPEALPPEPEMADFSLSKRNVESAAGTGGPVNETTENQQVILNGQTGDLCINWSLAEPVDAEIYTVRFITEPRVEAIENDGPIDQQSGVRCYPISSTFEDMSATYGKPLVYYIRTQTTNHVTGALAESLETKVVQVYRPVCYVNVGGGLLIREGPGRNYPDRGELGASEAVFAKTRPITPREQSERLSWVQITLPDDPRPGWIASDYLDCPVAIDPLPVAAEVPATPTPLPSPTPLPTLTPTATPHGPEVSVEPPIINLPGCALVKWSIINVKEVYLNGEGVIGEGERQVCPRQAGETTFIWRIVNLDGSMIEKSATLLANGVVGDPPPDED